MKLGTPWRFTNSLFATAGLPDVTDRKQALRHFRRRFRNERIKAAIGLPVSAAILAVAYEYDLFRILSEASSSMNSSIGLFTLTMIQAMLFMSMAAVAGYFMIGLSYAAYRVERAKRR